MANNLIPHFVTWLNAWKNGADPDGGDESYTWTMPGELKFNGVRAGAGNPCPCGSGRVSTGAAARCTRAVTDSFLSFGASAIGV